MSCIIDGFLVGGFTETLHYLSKFLIHDKNLHILWDADIRPGLFCLLCEEFQQELTTLEQLPQNIVVLTTHLILDSINNRLGCFILCKHA